MRCVSVLYPNGSDTHFDHSYYLSAHMPLVMERLHSFGLLRYEVDRGLGGGAPDSPAAFAAVGRLYFQTIDEFQTGMTAHGAEILGDIPNYTNIQPQIQVSELTVS